MLAGDGLGVIQVVVVHWDCPDLYGIVPGSLDCFRDPLPFPNSEPSAPASSAAAGAGSFAVVGWLAVVAGGGGGLPLGSFC